METEFWLLAVHVIGVILWVAGLTAALAMLHVHPQGEEKSRALLTAAERRVGILMDLGATAAIASGLKMAIWGTINQFTNGSWLHIKLTAVVVCVLSVHGFTRVKIKKFRQGDLRPVPAFMYLLLAAGVVIAAVLGADLDLLRK